MKRKLFQLAISFLVAISLTACFSSIKKLTGQKSEKPLPNWVLNPPADNSLTYYGVGQGSDLDRAKNQALKEISSKISVSVGGKTQLTSTVRNENFSQLASVQVNTETQNKELQNYKIEKSEQRDGQFFTQVSIEKADLAKSWKDKLKQLDDTLQSDSNALKAYPVLRQYIAWQKLQPKISEASSLIPQIKVVDTTFQSQSYDQRLLAYNDAARDNFAKLNVMVYSDQPEVAPVVNEIIKHLTESGVKTSSSRTGQTNTIINVTATERQEIIFKSYTIEMRLSLSTKDTKGKIIATNPVNIAGGSVIDYPSARISAANELGKKIKKDGIFSILGLGE